MDGARDNGHDPEKSWIFVDVDAGKKFAQWRLDELPCLTASRGKSGFVCTQVKRRLTAGESLRFQGICGVKKTDVRAAGLSSSDMGFAAGNAMSCNVLERLLPSVLYKAGLLKSQAKDPWIVKGYNPFLKH